jgi:hypothetical protein
VCGKEVTVDRRLLLAALSLMVLVGGGWAVRARLSSAQELLPEIIVYWEDNFEGRSVRITGTVLDMPAAVDPEGNEYSWNDKVRSVVVVRGTWRLFQHGRCNTTIDRTRLEDLDVRGKEPTDGWSTLVSASAAGPVQYASANGTFAPDDISSIQLVSLENLPAWATVVSR